MNILLPGSLSFHSVNKILSLYLIMDRVYNSRVLEREEVSNRASCHLHGKLSSMILDWKSGYINDPAAKILFDAIREYGGKVLSTVTINSVAIGYRPHLKNNLIQIMGDKLVLFKPINMASKYIALIITPASLVVPSSVITMQVLPVDTWGDIKYCCGYAYDFFGLE